MKTGHKSHPESLESLKEILSEVWTLDKSLKTLREQLLNIKYPNPLGICCQVGLSGLFTTIAYHILNLETNNRVYWLLSLEEGKYVTPVYNKEEKELAHPKTGIPCMDYYHEHHDKLKNNPDLPLQPLDLARQKLVADVVDLIDTLLGD